MLGIATTPILDLNTSVFNIMTTTIFGVRESMFIKLTITDFGYIRNLEHYAKNQKGVWGGLPQWGRCHRR